MKTRKWLSISAAISLVSTPCALAHGHTGPPPSQQRLAADTSGGFGTRDISGLTLIGTEVQMPNGEELGVVTEVIADESGYARYAVISHGGFMGFDVKRTAIPWPVVQSLLQNGKLIVDPAHIEKAPVLSGDKTPPISIGNWSREADNYWNALRLVREKDIRISGLLIR